MSGPYQKREQEKPRIRRLAILLGALVTAALVAALVWSIWQGPHACARFLDAHRSPEPVEGEP